MVQCLQQCSQLGLKSIAIPSIGAGNLKYPDTVVAQCLLDETLRYLEGNHGKTSLQLVHFVVFMPRTFQAFENRHRILVSGHLEEEEWVSIPSNLNLAIDATVVLTIYGITEQSVEMAEKNLRSIIDTHIVSEPIDDPRICQLPMQTVESLRKVAIDHQVDFDIDQEKALHTINLRGFQSDVLAVKDKVHDALAAVSKEETKADAADAVYATIRWTRLLSKEEMDDYDPLTNYEIEQAHRKKQEEYKYETDAEKFVVDFTAMQETDCITSEVTEIKRRDLMKGKTQKQIVCRDVLKWTSCARAACQGHLCTVHFV